jgi:hypothetical protein
MSSSWNSVGLEVMYQVLGWVAFFAWSFSFYPQVLLNYRRKRSAPPCSSWPWFRSSFLGLGGDSISRARASISGLADEICPS